MRVWRRLRVRPWYPPFVAFWAFFFISIPALAALAGVGNFFVIVWYLSIGWITQPYGHLLPGVFPFVILGPAPILLLPFALKLAPEDENTD